MDRKQYVLIVALSVVTGLVGGVVAGRLFMGAPVFAQKMPLVTEVIRAEKFKVVDKNGKPRAAIGLGDGEQPLLVFGDENEKVRLGIALKADGQPGLEFYDKKEKVVLKAP